MRIVVDHVVGSRQGQRQEFEPGARVRFGRHPDNEVSFDAHRDLDASSRHAELQADGDSLVLRDVGSSNGTYVDGHRITEYTIEPGLPVLVEFGRGGPRVRLFVGDDDAVSALPRIEHLDQGPQPRRTRIAVISVSLAVLIGAVIAAILWRSAW